jgi:hypothetical protein
MSEHTKAEKIAAQKKFQEEKNYPDFTPSNGVCWSCHGQIYDRITFEEAGTTLITGCPHCARSYCE